MASHIIIETYFDEHEMEQGLCVSQYNHVLQSGALKNLLRDPGKASENVSLPMMVQRLISPGSCVNT
ncbi:hypothetical protein RB213_011752 [Colletotrichum asianum]